jgi:hypothetical protein
MATKSAARKQTTETPDLGLVHDEMGDALGAFHTLLGDMSAMTTGDEGRDWLIHRAKWALLDELKGHHADLGRFAESFHAPSQAV